MNDSLIGYMQAKLLALAFQMKYLGNGDRHPFFNYAITELTYYLKSVADLKGNRKGQIVARNFVVMLKNEPEEKQKHKRYVLPLSNKQAYVIAKEIVEHNIPCMTAYEIGRMEEDDDD